MSESITTSPGQDGAGALGIGTRLLDALPDFLMALVLGVIAYDQTLGTNYWSLLFDGLGWDKAKMVAAFWIVLPLEALLLWPQMIVADIATRAAKRPHWATIAILPIVLLLWLFLDSDPSERVVLFSLSNTGFLLLVAWLWQRCHMLWTMPTSSNLEKMRARAVIGGRANIAVVVIAAAIAFRLGCVELHVCGSGFLVTVLGFEYASWYVAATLFFLLTAFDRWRIGGAGFARNPRPLFRFDYIDVRRVGAGS